MILKHFPKPFLEDLINNRCLPIVGAGLSMNARLPAGGRLPSWDQLGRAFAGELDAHVYSSAIESISEYTHMYGRTKLVEKLSEYLSVDNTLCGDAQNAFCKLPFEWVLTTNFDMLLESGYQSVGRYCRPVLEESDLSVDIQHQAERQKTKARVNLLKLHGDLHHPSRLIVTEDDYDGFLDKYRQISTFLANQLIFKTPIFIGYSLEDYDFRQVWQIVKNRLGKLTRPGYVIRLKTSTQERARFERRGVTVIDLPGEYQCYDQVLAEAFEDLREYWLEMTRPKLTRDTLEKVCLFSFPETMLDFYKQVVFPLAKRHGFRTSLAIDSLRADDNLTATLLSLVDGADAIVCDVMSDLDVLSIAESSQKPLLIVSEEGIVLPKSRHDLDLVFRPGDLVHESPLALSEFTKQLNSWFELQATAFRPAIARRPLILLAGSSYQEAVTAAVSLLIYDLRRYFAVNEVEAVANSTLPLLIKRAIKAEYLTDGEAVEVGELINAINQEHRRFSRTEAEHIVQNAMKFIDLLSTKVEAVSDPSNIETQESIAISADPIFRSDSLESEPTSGWKIPEEFQTIFDLWKQAISSADKDTVTSLIEYPLTVRIRDTTLHFTREEVAERYDSIFNEPVREIIASADLWQNWQGIAVGHGTMWFQPDVSEGKLRLQVIQFH